MPGRYSFNRPYGTPNSFYLAYIPSSKLLGYCQTSLRDREPRIDLCNSQT
jgi:hypothetical protein